jgi:hypothetical protein
MLGFMGYGTIVRPEPVAGRLINQQEVMGLDRFSPNGGEKQRR